MVDHDAGPPPPAALDRAAVAAPKAWRLTYTFDAGGVRLAAQQPIDKLAPPDDSADVPPDRAGYWVEVSDASGAVLYRQVITDPFHRTREVHSPEPGVSPTHVTAADTEGVFQVIIPDLPEAQDVTLLGLLAPGEPEPMVEPPEPTEPEEPAEPDQAQPERGRARKGRGKGKPRPTARTARPLLTERLVASPPFEVT